MFVRLRLLSKWIIRFFAVAFLTHEHDSLTFMQDSKVDPCTPNLLKEEQANAIASLFRALADPNRLQIVHQLFPRQAEGLCVSDLSKTLKMEQSAVSHQLRVLRNLQLVDRRLEGRHAFYRLRDEHVKAIYGYILGQLDKTQPKTQTSLEPNNGRIF